MAITQTFTTPTTAPARTQDSDTFNTNVDNRFAWDATHVTELNTWTGQANALETNVNTKEASATTSATNAATSATNAATSATNAVNSPGTSATSATGLTVATGSQSLTIQTGKSLVVGMPVIIARTSAPSTVYMVGIITSYTSGTGSLVVSVTKILGSGTYTDWTISLTGLSGSDGLSVPDFINYEMGVI